MQTITLLNKLDNIAENNIDALSSFNWSDINECILLELSLLSGLYDSQQSLNIQNRISFILSSCEQYTRFHNTPRLRNCLAELIGIVTALPSSAPFCLPFAQAPLHRDPVRGRRSPHRREGGAGGGTFGRGEFSRVRCPAVRHVRAAGRGRA